MRTSPRLAPVLVLFACARLLAWCRACASPRGFRQEQGPVRPLDWSRPPAPNTSRSTSTPRKRPRARARGDRRVDLRRVRRARSACARASASRSSPTPRTRRSSRRTRRRGFIGEGTGGLTELIKGRVLHPAQRLAAPPRVGDAPRAGRTPTCSRSWRRMRKETGKYRGRTAAAVVHRGTRRVPARTKWDADAEGLLQDAVVTGVALPLTRSGPISGTVLMYKEGQSFLELRRRALRRQARGHGPVRALDGAADVRRDLGDDVRRDARARSTRSGSRRCAGATTRRSRRGRRSRTSPDR